MAKIDFKQRSLYYEIHGNGTPLLLIAGLGSDSSSWASVIKDLAANFRTIAFDNRGCGRSGIGEGGHSISDMAKDAIDLLDNLEIKKACILGHSMGGYIAQEIAINYPGRVDKLILASTATVSSKRNNGLFERMHNRLKTEGSSESWFREWVHWLFSSKFQDDKEFVSEFVKGAFEYPYKQSVQGFKEQIDAIASFNGSDRVKSIKAKTLILEGENDILITPEEVSALANSVNNCSFRLIQGIAHCIHIEEPKLITRMVSDFLNICRK